MNTIESNVKFKSVCTLESNGVKVWRSQGFVHREDGPAIERPDGTRSWYLSGVYYRSIDTFCKAANITGQNKTIFLLKWNF